MAVNRRAGPSRVTLAVLLLASATLITLDLRGDASGVVGTVRDGALSVVSPVRDAADVVFGPIGDALAAVVNHGELREENQRLRAQLAEATTRAEMVGALERERDDLAALLGIELPGDLEQIAARVTSDGTGNAEVVIEIDRGTDHGVAVGMPVAAGGGLVGRVERAASDRSVVRLLSDPRLSVGVRFAEGGDVAVARGGGRGRPLQVDLVAPDAAVADGGLVLTSGLQQSVFPPGLAVGRVKGDRLTAGALQRDVTLAPIVDLDRLAFVSVLVWGPG